MTVTKIKTLDNVKRCLFIAMLALAPLSFTPSVSLNTHGFVSFRIGLYQVLALCFSVIMLPTLWHKRQAIIKDRWLFGPILILVFLALISPLRSVDPVRSILLCSSFTLLLTLVLSGWAYIATVNHKTVQQAVTAMLGVATAACLFALIQFCVATFSKTTHVAGLCLGCSAGVFGFPRVNSFAAEPQFFANALLVPLIASFVLYIKRGNAWLLALFSLFALTITLTLSRGGYVAAGLGLLTAIAFLVRLKFASMKRLLVILSCGLAAFIIALLLMIASARIHYPQTANITHDTFVTIVSQLSGGRISLQKASIQKETKPTKGITSNKKVFKSPGVITASEKDRETAATHALRWWRSSIQTALFGLGLGNLGSFAHQQDPKAYPLSFTVYIQYVFMLTELGVIGLMSFLIVFWLSIKRTWQAANRQSYMAVVLCSALVAFAVQYVFFGTYINAVYTWLYLGIGLGILQAKQLTPGAKRR